MAHNFDWNNIQILDIKPCYNKCLIFEILNIKKQKNSLILQTDTGLYKAYTSIINKKKMLKMGRFLSPNHIRKIICPQKIENNNRSSGKWWEHC